MPATPRRDVLGLEVVREQQDLHEEAIIPDAATGYVAPAGRGGSQDRRKGRETLAAAKELRNRRNAPRGCLAVPVRIRRTGHRGIGVRVLKQTIRLENNPVEVRGRRPMPACPSVLWPCCDGSLK